MAGFLNWFLFGDRGSSIFIVLAVLLLQLRRVQAEDREILSEEYTQWSLARQDLVNKVKNKQLKRPKAVLVN
jgi:hypothetical protein